MKSKFMKYPSIENHYRDKFISFVYESLLNSQHQDKWAVYEKIHGANFSFIVNDDGNISCAKRTSIINDDEKFFNYKRVVDKYRDTMLDILAYIKQMIGFDDIQRIQVYGELCGAGVQKIHYFEEQEFVMFDIFVTMKNDMSCFISTHALNDITNRFGMINPLICVEGGLYDTINKYAKIVNDTKSKFDHFDELIEGFVLKPISNNLRLPNGDRVAIKIKADRFFDNKSNKKRSSGVMSDALVSLLPHVGDNLVDSAISKVGSPDKKNMGDLIALVLEDIKNDLPDDYVKLTKQDVKKLSGIIARKILKKLPE